MRIQNGEVTFPGQQQRMDHSLCALWSLCLSGWSKHKHNATVFLDLELCSLMVTTVLGI